MLDQPGSHALVMPEATWFSQKECKTFNNRNLIGLQLADTNLTYFQIDILLDANIIPMLELSGEKMGQIGGSVRQNMVISWIISGKLPSEAK